jgi:hypothetical protein
LFYEITGETAGDHDDSTTTTNGGYHETIQDGTF